jgi:hypothetical protein
MKMRSPKRDEGHLDLRPCECCISIGQGQLKYEGIPLYWYYTDAQRMGVPAPKHAMA